MLRSYRPALFGKDLVAGLVVTTLLVPQGMAYAELAGLPAITGLYTTILACSVTPCSARPESSFSGRTHRSAP